MTFLPFLSLAFLCPPPLPLLQPPLQQPLSLVPLLPQHLPQWALQLSQSVMLRGRNYATTIYYSILVSFVIELVLGPSLSQNEEGSVLSNHLAGPNVNGEINELRVLLDEVLDGLQLQIV